MTFDTPKDFDQKNELRRPIESVWTTNTIFCCIFKADAYVNRTKLKEFLEQLSRLLIYGGIIQGIFITLLLTNKRARKSRANYFLSFLLLALSFSVFHILYAGKVLNHLAINAYNVGDPTFLIIAPALFFYTEELTGHRVQFSMRVLLHFIPFITIILFSTFFKSISWHSSFVTIIDPHHRIVSIVFWVFIVFQFSWYLYYINKRLKAYQKLVQAELSNTEDVNISWIRFFMTIFLLINIFFLFNLFVVIHLDNIRWMEKTIAVIFSISIYALGFKGILQKEIFHTGVEEIAEIENNAPTTPPENKFDAQQVNDLLLYMEQKKPYLDPELSLTTLAKQFGVNRGQLSQLINEGIGDNFYNFVNKYRVEQVKKFMTDPQLKNYNMLGLALEAGFKSKSTFNLIFKRFTGLTPTEFRKNISE
jgi:AraC-like DNA-binding protein